MRRGTQWNLATPAMRAASVLMVGLTCADAAAPIRVFPAPHSIAPVCAPVALDGGAAIPVVVVENPADAIQAGVDVLQKRLAKLGGSPWQVAAEAPASGAAPVVYLAVAGTGPRAQALIDRFGVAVTPADPGPQGYAIVCREDGGRLEVLVAGSDETGALYGCVTLAHFIAAAALSAQP